MQVIINSWPLPVTPSDAAAEPEVTGAALPAALGYDAAEPPSVKPSVQPGDISLARRLPVTPP